MFKLTSTGEQEAESIGNKRDHESKILSYMYMVNKPVEIEEIQDEAKLSDAMTVQVLTRMQNSGLVIEV